MAKTLQKVAKVLKGVSKERERMKERKISRGRRRRNMKVDKEMEEFVVKEQKTEERFWPMKIKKEIAAPAWDARMRNSVRKRPVTPNALDPTSPYV